MSGSTDFDRTPNYQLYKPVPDADVDVWGDHLNWNSDTLDALIHTIDSGKYVPLAGNVTMTGPLVLSGDPTAPLSPVSLQYYTAHLPAVPGASGTPPVMDGAGAIGTGTTWARSDHQHPSDTSRVTQAQGDARWLQLAGGTLSGALTLSGNAAANLQPTTLQQMNAAIAAIPAPPSPSNVLPLIEGTAAIGVSLLYARADHVHPAFGGGTTTTIGDIAPSSPSPGALWWDSVSGQLYIRFQDADSSQWVIANSATGVTDAPNDGHTYARNNQAWLDISSSIGVGNNNTGRNLVHNPLFDVAQRGAGPWTTSVYMLDRWLTAFTTDAASFSQIALVDADRAQIGDESARYSMQNVFTGNSAAGAYTSVQHWIETIRRLSGKTITVSFWAKCAASTKKLGVSFDQWFGTGGSPSATVNGTGQSVTVTTTWTRYSLTFSIPSASGKTFGTNGNDCTGMNIWYSSGTTNATRSGTVGVQSGTVSIWGVQVEYGNVATPLAKREYADELRLCQRFFQSYSPPRLVGVAGYGTAAVSRMGMVLPVPMRATPSLTLVSALPCYSGASANTITAIQNTYNTPFLVEFDAQCQNAWAADASGVVVYQGAGGQMTFSADL